MSIFATVLSLSENQHEDGCKVYVEDPPGSGCFDFSGDPCTCGTPRAPFVYEGSHVYPVAPLRGGAIDVAEIPHFITAAGYDEEGEANPWLRLSLFSATEAVLLDVALVTELRDSLTAWLERGAR